MPADAGGTDAEAFTDLARRQRPVFDEECDDRSAGLTVVMSGPLCRSDDVTGRRDVAGAVCGQRNFVPHGFHNTSVT